MQVKIKQNLYFISVIECIYLVNGFVGESDDMISELAQTKIIYHVTFSHHYQVSIDFNTVNIHRTVGMDVLIFSSCRNGIDDIICWDHNFTFCSLGSLSANIALGTVFLYTPKFCPMDSIFRHTPKYCPRDSIF